MIRLFRFGLFASIALLVAFGVGALLRAPVCYPFDYLWNMRGAYIADAAEADELRAPKDGKVRVVFLQHGLWRTPMSLDRLERTLRHNGYEVVNTAIRARRTISKAMPSVSATRSRLATPKARSMRLRSSAIRWVGW